MKHGLVLFNLFLSVIKTYYQNKKTTTNSALNYQENEIVLFFSEIHSVTSSHCPASCRFEAYG